MTCVNPSTIARKFAIVRVSGACEEAGKESTVTFPLTFCFGFTRKSANTLRRRMTIVSLSHSFLLNKCLPFCLEIATSRTGQQPLSTTFTTRTKRNNTQPYSIVFGFFKWNQLFNNTRELWYFSFFFYFFKLSSLFVRSISYSIVAMMIIIMFFQYI